MSLVTSYRVLDKGNGQLKLVDPRFYPRPYAKIGRSAALGVTGGAADMDFDVELANQGPMVIDLATDNDITVKESGLYMIIFDFQGVASGAMEYRAYILKGATTIHNVMVKALANGDFVNGQLITFANLVIGDAISVNHVASANTDNLVVTNDFENALTVVKL